MPMHSTNLTAEQIEHCEPVRHTRQEITSALALSSGAHTEEWPMPMTTASLTARQIEQLRARVAPMVGYLGALT